MTRHQWPRAAIAASLLSAAVVLADAELKNWNKGPAGLLLTKDEDKDFKSRKDDAARQQWIDEFWKKLDPTPDTPENEAQMVFDKRVEMVKKATGEDGWKSDLGKAMVILGPPASSKTEGGPGKGGADAGGPGNNEYPGAAAEDTSAPGSGTETAEASGGEMGGATRREKSVVLLTYKEGTPGLGANTELRFEGTAGHLALKTKGVDLSRATFVSSIPKSAPPAAAAAAPAPATAPGTSAPSGTAAPADPVMAEIAQILQEKRVSTAIPVKAQPYFFPSPDGNVYMPIVLEADLSGLPAISASRPVHVIGAVFKDGALVRDFARPYDVTVSGPKTMMTKAEVIQSGTYELYIGVRDASGTYGLIQLPIQTPDFSQPSMSSMVLSKTGPVQTPPLDPNTALDTVTQGMRLGPYEFQPYVGDTMKPTDPLNVFYLVMKTGGDAAGNPKLSVKYELDLNGEPKGKFNIPELASSVIAHPIDIAKLKLSPGNYELKILITDLIGGATINKTQPLVLQ